MSRWLEPPLKLADAVNTLLDALRERARFCFGDNYYIRPNTELPVKKLSYYLRLYNDVTECMEWVRMVVRSLIPFVLIDPMRAGEMTKTFPYAYDTDRAIRSILDNAGINPAAFFDERPYLASDKNFYEAAYYLINNYLTFAANINVQCEYSEVETVYFADKIKKREDLNEGTTYDMRQIARCNYVSYISGAHYYYVYELVRSKLTCTIKNSYSPPFGTLKGKWELQKTVELRDCKNSQKNTLATYPQIFTFDGDVADAPSLAGDYVDDIGQYLSLEETDKWLREYIQHREHWNGGYDYYYLWLDAADTLVSVNRNNFPAYKYYDPPEKES